MGGGGLAGVGGRGGVRCGCHEERGRARGHAHEERGVAGVEHGRSVDRRGGAIELASRPEMKGKRIVVIFADAGERYVSLPFFAP